MLEQTLVQKLKIVESVMKETNQNNSNKNINKTMINVK